MLSPSQDGCGQAIYDHHRGRPAFELIERDDGWIGPLGGAPAYYFAPFSEWPPHQQQALAHVRGRVLDIGCGAGRIALYLQDQGHEVVAIDSSPLAVKTARLRGVQDARVLSITQLTRRLGPFDTLVMLGQNFGLFGTPERARWLLRQRFRGLTTPGARILAETVDHRQIPDPDYRRYARFNLKQGRPAGQFRMRVRCGRAATPWFDYLFASPREMRAIVSGTGWKITELVRAKVPVYVAVLEKVDSA